METTANEHRKVYTLLDLTKSLQAIIRKTYTGSYWIKAEIARLNFYPKSGHCYPDLVYKVDGKVKAEMRALIWRNDFRRLNEAFRQEVKEELKDGMQVLFRANVSFHPKYSLSLNIVDIEPAFTLGEMAREKAETVAALKKEGVFTRNKELPFPLLPKRLAVISVSTSKGYHDFLNIINNNRYGFKIDHELFSALLQGDRCAASISGQLEAIRKIRERFDAVAIIRGGGGDVGLNAYDDLELAREVAAFPLPVISGIGHSTNETVVEMVAHLNKITPTDVAYFFLGKFQDLYFRIKQLKERVVALTGNRIMQESRQLAGIEKVIYLHVKHFAQTHAGILQTYQWNISKAALQRIINERRDLARHPDAMRHAVSRTVGHERKSTDRLGERLRALATQQMKKNQNRLDSMATLINLLNPEKVLKRGYSITLKDGKPVTSAKQVTPGDIVTTRVYEGTFESEINSKSS